MLAMYSSRVGARPLVMTLSPLELMALSRPRRCHQHRVLRLPSRVGHALSLIPHDRLRLGSRGLGCAAQVESADCSVKGRTRSKQTCTYQRLRQRELNAGRTNCSHEDAERQQR